VGEVPIRLFSLMLLDNQAALDGRIGRRKPSDDTLSEMNISLIHGWIDTCKSSHSRCRQKTRALLPTRVIDVVPVSGSQNPRLVVTNGQQEDYVALSHCWGSLMASEAGKHARTLKQNLDAMVAEIPLVLLPQNFQDAITTVRKLNLRYLWIDALCIIQDDALDWAREAARMGDVYGSAYLTIVATSAASSTDGFLQRPRSLLPTIAMPYFKRGDSYPDGYFYVAHRRTMDDESWYENVDFAKWNKRGWTFQEQLLSGRLLHFTSRQLFWECPTTDSSEENLPRRMKEYRPRWISKERSKVVPPSEEFEMIAIDRRYEEWYELVIEYVPIFPCVI